jgi:DNA ligase 1
MILYKKDTKGKYRYLDIYTKGSVLIQTSGIVDTENPVEHLKVCKGKNVGRSNETSPEEQAILEMNSKIEEKLSEGYFKELESCKTEDVILPMLAKSYNDEKEKIDWDDCYVQPKLDGQRALGINTLISRQGKLIETLPHIENSIRKYNIYFDGECYAHGKNFQENMRLIKKYRQGETELVKYHVYDIVDDIPFVERCRKLASLKLDDNIILVPTFKINSEADLKYHHANFLQNGYEGTIIRWGKEGYKSNGRSSHLLKYKDFIDISLPIINITANEVSIKQGTPHFEINGEIFKAGVKMSHEEREEFLNNKQKYIGKMAELRFFEYSENGIPRFPVMCGIRLDC